MRVRARCIAYSVQGSTFSQEALCVACSCSNIRPVSSPAIFSHPKHRRFFLVGTCRHFFLAGICQHFVPIRYCRHLFRPKIAGIFFNQKLLAYFSIRNCYIFCDWKLSTYIPTQTCQHFIRPETAGIFFGPKLPAFFLTQNCLVVLPRRCCILIFIFFSFFNPLNKVYSIQLITCLANDPSRL